MSLVRSKNDLKFSFIFHIPNSTFMFHISERAISITQCIQRWIQTCPPSLNIASSVLTCANNAFIKKKKIKIEKAVEYDVQWVAEDKQRLCHRHSLTVEEGYWSILTLVTVSVQMCRLFFLQENTALNYFNLNQHSVSW